MSIKLLKQFITESLANFTGASAATPCKKCGAPGAETDFGQLCMAHYSELEDAERDESMADNDLYDSMSASKRLSVYKGRRP